MVSAFLTQKLSTFDGWLKGLFNDFQLLCYVQKGRVISKEG